MDINVKDIEVLKRRTKYTKPCDDTQSFDNVTLKQILQIVGCRPPYWNANFEVELPQCNTKDELKDLTNRLSNAVQYETGQYENGTPPCNEVQKVDIDFSETDFNIQKILSGSDVDIDLDNNTIMQAWMKNGQY